jgi:hypothetical protein
MRVHQGKAALAFLSGEMCAGEIIIQCPNCGCDYTHVRHVGTLVGTDQHEPMMAYDGTFPTGTTPRSVSE